MSELNDLKEFKYGWPVVLSSGMGIGLGMSPLPFYTLGVFVAPFMKEFGWKVDQIMLAFAVLSLTAMFTAPAVGYLSDRFTARKVVLISVVTFALSFMAFAFNNGSHWLYLGLYILLAVFGSGTLPVTWTKTVHRWFIKKRGLALGLSLLWTGLFGAFAKQYASYFIQNYDWRTAYIALGALPLIIVLPLAYFFFRDTSDPKVADKVSRMKNDLSYYQDHSEKVMPGMELSEALKSYKFWILALSFVPISIAIGGPIPNFETILGVKEFSVTEAVNAASFLGVAVVVGRLGGGYLIDKFWAPAVAFIIFMFPIIACYLFQLDDLSYTNAYLAVGLIGLAAGVEYDLMAFFVSKYFGLKNYGAIYGALYGFFAIGAGFGPWIFAKIYETTGSYNPAFGYAMIAFIVGAIPFLFLGKYQYD